MRIVLQRSVLLLAVVGACLASGRVMAAVGCAQFELFVEPEYGFYYATYCDGEPNSCTVLDYVGMDASPPYDPNELPRDCRTNVPPYSCEYVGGGGGGGNGTGARRAPTTQNVAQVPAAQGVQQVVYYQCGRRCYCCTVCVAAAPAATAQPAASSNSGRRDPSQSPHVSVRMRLKAPKPENYTPTKNQKAPFAENINLSFPSYFSFASLRKPGTIIHAKGFVVTTQKFAWSGKTFPGLTLTTGYEVQKQTETYPLISAQNVKLAPNTTSTYIVKVSGVDYVVHTTE